MKQSSIIVRMSKSSGIYNKPNTFLLRMAGEPEHKMNFKNNRSQFLVAPGTHTIEIGNEVSSQKVEVLLKVGKTKILTINPCLTYRLGLGIMIGLVFTSIVIQLVLSQKISALNSLPFLYLIFIKKSNFRNSFAITQTSKFL